MSEIKTIWRGSTPCIRTTVPDNIAESIDSMIFSLKTGNTIIQKAYPGNVTKVGNVYHVGFSQNDTEQLENGKCTFQVQYNYKNSNVSYSNIIMYIADTPNNIEIIGDGSTKGTTDFIDVTITADNVVLATDGITFTPVVTSPSDDKLTLSWENDGGAENPESVTITAPKGTDGHTPVRGTDYWTEADKAVILAEAIDRTCPTGSAESLTSSLTLADCCGGTNVRNYVIHGAEGGVGDLNSGTGKYEIPVTVRGKNLLARVETRTDNGITYDLNADRWIMNGSASSNSYIPTSTTQAVNLKPGTYTVSYTYISGTMDSAASAFHLGLRVVGTGNWIKDLGVSPRNYKTKITASFTLTEEKKGSWYSVGVGTVTNLTFAMQIEKGSEATDFEPYTASKEYAISLDAPLGTGEAVTRETGGDITLTDAGTNIIEVGTATAPGKIEVEYYKDINKIVNNLTNAILAQGGNV